MHLFGGRDNAQGSWKRKGREKSRTGFKDAEKHTKIKQDGHSVNGNRRYDGNTVFAGAITENVKSDLDVIKGFLKNSDSGRFFQKTEKQYCYRTHSHKSYGYRCDFKIRAGCTVS